MYLIASDIVWTWTMIPVDSATESPSGVYSAKLSSPISLTIGDAEMLSAVSRALTSPPRRREESSNIPRAVPPPQPIAPSGFASRSSSRVRSTIAISAPFAGLEVEDPVAVQPCRAAGRDRERVRRRLDDRGAPDRMPGPDFRLLEDRRVGPSVAPPHLPSPLRLGHPVDLVLVGQRRL